MAKTWKGQFSSSQYPPGYVTWNAEITLRAPPEEGYDSIFKVNYNGLFRHGQTYSSTTKVGRDVFKGSFGPQQLTFTVNERSPNEIAGEYFSLNPADHGTFTLKS